MSLLNLPATITTHCSQTAPGLFCATVWETLPSGARLLLALEESTTRLSAIRAAVQAYWVGRIAAAQLLTENLR